MRNSQQESTSFDITQKISSRVGDLGVHISEVELTLPCPYRQRLKVPSECNASLRLLLRLSQFSGGNLDLTMGTLVSRVHLKSPSNLMTRRSRL